MAASPVHETSEVNTTSAFTWRLVWASTYCAMGGLGFGIDYGYWSGVLGMKQFSRDFGVLDHETNEYFIPSSWKSLGSGLPMAGLVVGSLLAGLIGNRWGRINSFRVSSYISLVGVLIQATCMNSYWQMTVGRIVNTLALGIVANACPAYLAEIAPLNIRGSLVNTYQFCIGVGALLVNTVNWGMHTRTDHWAWRTVVVLQFFQPTFYVIGAFFIPESPRWLVGKGRLDEAYYALRTLRSYSTDQEVRREAGLIAASEEDNMQKFSSSWKECFIGSNLRRTLIATGVQCLKQAQGDSFMSSYAVVFFQALGVQDVYKIMILYIFVMAISSVFGFYIPDRVGRRPLLIWTAALMFVCMYAVAGLKGFSIADAPGATKGATAALFLWNFSMAIGWSSCVWIVTAEIPTLQLREKTITISTVAGFIVSVLVTFIGPFLQDGGYAGLEGRIGFIYGSFSLIAVIWTFFLVPETGFCTLEELDELFQHNVATRNFRKHVCIGGQRPSEDDKASGIVDEEVVDEVTKKV